MKVFVASETVAAASTSMVPQTAILVRSFLYNSCHFYQLSVCACAVVSICVDSFL